MKTNSSKLPPIPLGWEGGFSESNPNFAYPNPDLSSLSKEANMAHITLLKRQQGVRWPEFSWLTELGDDNTRCFQMFSPFASRLGYTDTGRIYSIICPQQGLWIKDEVCLNVEVTVTGVRGWANESEDKSKRTMAADMTVQIRIWLSPSQHQGNLIKEVWPHLQHWFPEMPLSKKHAILVNGHEPNQPDQPIFKVRKGETDRFESPEYAKHYNDRGFYTVANLNVQVGDIEKKNNAKVDEFNQLLIDGFNLGSGNMLKKNNILTWNVWFTEPQLVNTQEWQDHAEKWRDSIDVHHGPPYSQVEQAEWPHLFDARPIKHFDGSHFNPVEDKLEHWLKELYDWIKHHI